MNRDVWVLTDSRVGNSVQALAIAEGLGVNYEIKEIQYNALSNLPNALFFGSLIHVKKEIRHRLISDIPPKIVISSGRRCAGVARYLKNKYPNAKFIQVLKPEIDINVFDLLVLPEHDRIDIPKDTQCKVIQTLGSMNNIAERIADYTKNFGEKYPNMDGFIGVLIGGNSKNYKYTESDAKEFCKNLKRIAGDSKLFITFSRRTPEFMKDLILSSFKKPHRIYDPEIDTNPINNPYIGILKYARYLIITADSVSMCSEAASSGKPLYIYSPKNFKPRKHNELISKLFESKIAMKLDNSVDNLEEYKYTKLNEAEKVVEYVKEHLM